MSNIIFIKRLDAYFILVRPGKIFKLPRNENQMSLWCDSGGDGGELNGKSLKTNQQESIVSLFHYNELTIIQIKEDGSPGKLISWKLNTYNDGLRDQVICDKDNDIRVYLLPSRAWKIYLFKPDWEKNHLKREKKIEIRKMEDKRLEKGICMTMCPLQKILGITFEFWPHQIASRIVLYEITGDSLNLLVNFDLSEMKLKGLPQIRILDYWGRDLLICFRCNNHDDLIFFKYSYKTNAIKEHSELRKKDFLGTLAQFDYFKGKIYFFNRLKTEGEVIIYNLSYV